jgi:hypothetical protein
VTKCQIDKSSNVSQREGTIAGAEDVWSVFAVPKGGQRNIWAGPVVTHDRLAATLARLKRR